MAADFVAVSNNNHITTDAKSQQPMGTKKGGEKKNRSTEMRLILCLHMDKRISMKTRLFSMA